MLEAILIGLVAVFCILDSRLLGRLNFERPLITCTLVGLILGDVQTGLATGSVIELITLGFMSVGAAGPPNMNLGAIVGTAYVIQTGSSVETALTVAVPMSLLYTVLDTFGHTIRISWVHLIDKYIDEGKFKKAKRVHIVWGPILYSVLNFVPVFLAVYFGNEFIEQIINVIPVAITDGLSLGTKIMSAYGFALLLSTMISKETAVFFFLGFFVTAYSGLGLTGSAIFGTILAVIMYQIKYKSGQAEVDDLDVL